MKQSWLLAVPAGVLLSSATPFTLSAEQPAELSHSGPLLQPETVMDFRPVILPVSVPTPRPSPDQDRPDVLPERPDEPPGGLRVVVSIPQQKLYLFDDGELLATSPVSTGKRGHATPTGTFPITQKKVHHRSSKYDNAPMPYMQRLTDYGIALHAGHVPGYPASHGCIRMPRSFAKKLYGLTRHGTRVTITRERPKSAAEALNLA
jgi:lipoprotein-anchoring transpeptidase ErfK/SrfK